MHKSTQTRPRGVTLFYVIALAFVAVTCALAVIADVMPSLAIPMIEGVDTQIAVFVVPLAMLMFAIIAEVVHSSFSGSFPAKSGKSAHAHRHLLGHSEG